MCLLLNASNVVVKLKDAMRPPLKTVVFLRDNQMFLHS